MAEGVGNTTKSEDLFTTDDRKLSAEKNQGIYSTGQFALTATS